MCGIYNEDSRHVRHERKARFLSTHRYLYESDMNYNDVKRNGRHRKIFWETGIMYNIRYERTKTQILLKCGKK